ncbi:hypothetical protein LZ24_01080 [Desulfobotulus alkaliphilus]|uniref:histidine kinase n=1 Tax=Desulfobotulus alkaliphilus TaxID=622671 RepID=A0A562S0Q3_9BACT|nr:hypothetical protein [Desulfobotulus alkaliphilus]TWI74140.1 hypothetical protein LZ24_01080 [Desulfobotulus alkaliphilus]
MRHFEEIHFAGKITASVTHELRNVLAVIRETSGLMQDIMSLQDQGKKISGEERIQSGFRAISDQIQRGSQLIDRLNRFAHSSDHPEESIDIQEAAADFFQLTERLCRIRRITLVPETRGNPIHITASKFYFYAALFQALEHCLSLPEDSHIPVSFTEKSEIYFHVSGLFAEPVQKKLTGAFLLTGDTCSIRISHNTGS